jgi:hypothetical protein
MAFPLALARRARIRPLVATALERAAALRARDAGANADIVAATNALLAATEELLDGARLVDERDFAIVAAGATIARAPPAPPGEPALAPATAARRAALTRTRGTKRRPAAAAKPRKRAKETA